MMSVYFRTITVLFVLFLCLSSGQGCGKGRAEAEKKILASDPSFQKVLDKRDALRNELDLQKEAYARKKEKIDEEIAALREKKDQVKKEYRLQIEKIKRQSYPEKKRLQRDLMEMERNYKWTKDEVRQIDKDINEISSLMGEKEKLDLTQDEAQEWNDKLDFLKKKKKTAVSANNKLREKIEITKMKIEVLE